MLLHPSISIGRLVGVVLALFVLAGCATGSTGSTPGSTVGRDKNDEIEGGQATVAIPPQILTLYEQAASAMAAGEFVDAELRFKEFLMQYPGYPGAYVNLAIIYSNSGNNEAAETAVNAALALDPGHPAALNQLGMLLRRNGKFLEAEAAYLKAVTVNPEYALAHYNLGILNELYLRRFEVALQHFETYKALVGEDKQVDKWIADLRRRVAAAQRTANATD